MRRGLRLFLASAVLALAACGAAAAPGRSVAVYGWADDIDPAVLDTFTEQTGIGVVYDAYDSPAAAEERLKGGRSGYDVAIIPSASLFRLGAARALLPLEARLLPHRTAPRPDLGEKLRAHDPGGRFGTVYASGTVGLALRPQRLREVAPGEAQDTLGLLFRPQAAARARDCGIAVLDAPTIVVPLALAAIGRPPDSTREADLKSVSDLLMRLKPMMRPPLVTGQPAPLAAGDICAGIATSNDVREAQRRAADAGGTIDLAYALPKEGVLVWFDMLAIPADSAHPAEAHALIDFLQRPDIAARNQDYLGTAAGNAARTDGRRIFVEPAYGDAALAALDRIWQRFKAKEPPAPKAAAKPAGGAKGAPAKGKPPGKGHTAAKERKAASPR